VNFQDPRRKVSLIAPLEGFEPGKPDSSIRARDHVVLFHPAYRRGDAAIEFVSQPSISTSARPVHARELDESEYQLPPADDYQDPVSTSYADYGGRWIVGFAPVGNTGFLLVVQERFEEALSIDPLVSWNIAIGIALLVGIMIATTLTLLRHRTSDS
jgi:hypothetical protein